MMKRIYKPILILFSIIIIILSYTTLYFVVQYKTFARLYASLKMKTQLPFGGISSDSPSTTFNLVKKEEIMMTDSFPVDIEKKHPNGMISEIDAITATRIAEAYLYPQYGNSILSFRPYRVYSKNNVWVVYSFWGTADFYQIYLEINKKNGAIEQCLRTAASMH